MCLQFHHPPQKNCGNLQKTERSENFERLLLSVQGVVYGQTVVWIHGAIFGVVEPIGAVVTILAAQLVIPALPYLLSFCCGRDALCRGGRADSRNVTGTAL